jgi:hypothetical protein
VKLITLEEIWKIIFSWTIQGYQLSNVNCYWSVSEVFNEYRLILNFDQTSSRTYQRQNQFEFYHKAQTSELIRLIRKIKILNTQLES